MRTTLTAFVPAHKQTNSEHVPGQVVNPLGFVDQTLGDYINRKLKPKTVYTECCGNPLRTGPHGRGCPTCPQDKKLTFEEWLEDSQVGYRSVETKADLIHYLELAWKAAQENK